MDNAVNQPSKRTQHANAMRSDILQAAAAIIASEGVKALTARHLAVKAGASTKIIYSHFGGMDGVTAAIYKYGFEMLTTCLTVAANDGASLHAVTLAYRQFALDNRDLFDILYGPKINAILPGERSRIVAQPSLQVLIDCFHADEAKARQFWARIHGAVVLELSQWLSADECIACLERAVLDAR
jgi:AcrR family transcriptional regulator